MRKMITFFALVLACSSANAANFSFNVNDGINIGKGSIKTDSNGFATNGTLEMTQGTVVGQYTLFSGGGAVPTASPNGAFIYDNIVLNVKPYIDYWGLLFTGNGLEINIWGNGVDQPFSFWSHNGVTYNVASNTASFNLNVETPIPAAVWLFGSALAGLIGFAKKSKG